VTSMARFCVSCGAEGVRLFGALCASCYVERNTLLKLPREVEIKRCRFCGSTWVQGKWVKDDNVLLSMVMSNSSLDPNVSSLTPSLRELLQDPSEGKVAIIEVNGKVGEVQFSINGKVRVNERNATCDSCLRKRGRKYEAIVQLRSTEGKMNDQLRRLFEDMLDQEAVENLCDVVVLREGVDYYFISKSVGRRVASKFSKVRKAWVSESHEGERIKDGKRESKLIISLRT